MDDVNTIFARRLRAIGIDPDDVGATPAGPVVTALASVLDSVFPALQDDPQGLQVVAEALRAYADVTATYAAAQL